METKEGSEKQDKKQEQKQEEGNSKKTEEKVKDEGAKEENKKEEKKVQQEERDEPQPTPFSGLKWICIVFLLSQLGGGVWKFIGQSYKLAQDFPIGEYLQTNYPRFVNNHPFNVSLYIIEGENKHEVGHFPSNVNYTYLEHPIMMEVPVKKSLLKVKNSDADSGPLMLRAELTAPDYFDGIERPDPKKMKIEQKSVHSEDDSNEGNTQEETVFKDAQYL